MVRLTGYTILLILLFNACTPALGMQSLKNLSNRMAMQAKIAATQLRAKPTRSVTPSIQHSISRQPLIKLPPPRVISSGESWRTKQTFFSRYNAWGRSTLAFLGLGFIFGQVAQPTASVWQQRAEGKQPTRNQMITAFIDDCKKFQSHNKKIPVHVRNEQTVRVATYNVHSFKDSWGNYNFDAIMKVIKDINADILVLQEVSVFDAKKITNTFEKLGYTQATFGATTNNKTKPFGNLIVSKYPLKQVRVKTYDADRTHPTERRCFIKSVVQLPHEKEINLIGTHLDVWDSTGKKRTKEIRELINNISETGNTLIAADFNAVRKKDYNYRINGKLVWELLDESHRKRLGINVPIKALTILENAGFEDNFSKMGITPPRFTAWSGTTVDFIYLNIAWQLPIIGSYTYYSAASDHLPVIMDVKIS